MSERAVVELLVEKVAPAPVLDLDQPQVGIEVPLALDECVGLRLAHTLSRKARDPAPVAFGAGKTGWGRPIEEAGSVEAVDLDEDRAGVIVAVANDDGRGALDGAPANVSLHPEFRAQSHGRQSRARPGVRKCGLRAVVRQFEISS